jgi:serine protease Do
LVSSPSPVAGAAREAATATHDAEQKQEINEIFAGEEPETVGDLRAMQARWLELAPKAIACTVSVRVGRTQGSGVIVSPDGYVLTAGHVVGEANREVDVILPDGQSVKAITLDRNRDVDAGLMRITETGPNGEKITWPHAEMGSSSNLQRGQWCLATGHPGGHLHGRKAVVRVGRVLSPRDTVITTDCTLVGGDSGGPLFDMNGNVIGIHSRIGSLLTANLHVPVDTYRAMWDRVGSAPSRGVGPFIGVEGDFAPHRAKIVRVLSGGAAEMAGVKADDVITQFDGREVTDFASLAAAVREKRPGDTARVQLRRGGETIELDLVVGTRDD